jgi:hypothetical protein
MEGHNNGRQKIRQLPPDKISELHNSLEFFKPKITGSGVYSRRKKTGGTFLRGLLEQPGKRRL